MVLKTTASAVIMSLAFSSASLHASKDDSYAVGCYSNARFSTCPFTEKVTISKKLSQDAEYKIGNFNFSWVGKTPSEAHIKIKDLSTNSYIFATPKGLSFLKSGKGKGNFYENRGAFVVDDVVKSFCGNQHISSISAKDDIFEISGSFLGSCQHKYRIKFKVVDSKRIDFIVSNSNKSINRSYLLFDLQEGEKFYGFGVQCSSLEMRKRRVPVFVSEQGIGRGLEPLTSAVDILGGAGVSGEWFTSYAPMPYFLTNKKRGVALDNYEYSVFDFTFDIGRIEVFSGTINGHIYSASKPLDIIEKHTEITGRFRPLPKWSDNGAVLGIQGGSKTVLSKVKKAIGKGMPVSAVWIQDWVGRRKTSFGSQLWWDWGLDSSLYSNWSNFKKELKRLNVKILGYINPYLVEIKNKNSGVRPNLFKYADEMGYLVKSKNGDENYLPLNSDFRFGIVDLTNPNARKWLKTVMKETLIKIGMSGWMSDFAESLPADASLFSGADAQYWHNKYPEEWSKITREVLDELNLDDETLFFSRSGYIKSPNYTSLYWMGDQLVTWDHYDGFKSAILGQISSGLSGIAFNHSDVGGYTTITSTIKDYKRSKELFMRWAEANTFTSLLRTHEGNMPAENHQFDSDLETFNHLKRFATIFKSLSQYRRELQIQASKFGYPVTRHMLLEFPDDETVYDLKYQFMFGSGFIVAPIVEPKVAKKRVYIPKDGFKHLFTDISIKKGWHEVDAPIGTPAVFYNALDKKAVAAAKKVQNSLRLLNKSDK